jgi:hypothetical protein
VAKEFDEARGDADMCESGEQRVNVHHVIGLLEVNKECSRAEATLLADTKSLKKCKDVVLGAPFVEEANLLRAEEPFCKKVMLHTTQEDYTQKFTKH